MARGVERQRRELSAGRMKCPNVFARTTPRQGYCAREPQPQRTHWPLPMRRNANHGRVAGRPSALGQGASQRRHGPPAALPLAPLAAGPDSSPAPVPAPACLFTSFAQSEGSVASSECDNNGVGCCRIPISPFLLPASAVLFCAVSRRRDSILSAHPGNTGLPRRIASRVVFWSRISLAWAATPRPLHTPPHARSHRQARTTLDGSTVPSLCDCARRKHPLLHSHLHSSPRPRRETDRV
jgi:hypothetical protein